MGFLVAALIARTAVPLRPVRAWTAHERPVGTVLPLSDGRVFTAGHLTEPNLRLWNPDGARAFDRKLPEPVSWVHERGGPDDLILGLHNDDLLSLRGGTLRTIGRVSGLVDPQAGDPPRRVFYSAPGSRVIESRADGRRIARPRADALAAHRGTLATIRDGRLWIEDPKGRVSSAPCPLGPLGMGLDAPSRTVVIHDTELLPGTPPTEGATHRLAAYGFGGKRLWKRNFPAGFATNLTLLDPYVLVTVSRMKPLRTEFAAFRLADGAAVPLPALPESPSALGTDPARRRLAIGTLAGEVRLYDLRP